MISSNTKSTRDPGISGSTDLKGVHLSLLLSMDSFRVRIAVTA